MKQSKHLGQSLSMGALLVFACVALVGLMFIESGIQ